MEKTFLNRIHSKCKYNYLNLKYTFSKHNDLQKLIEKSDVISFDIFDTVILRKVYNPKDIFTIVEKLYKQKYGQLNINFKAVRSKAEPEAYKIFAEENNKQCVNLDEIYKWIMQSYNLDIDIANNLKKLEIETELNFCTRNEYMYSQYQFCIERGKKVIFTSDMYLPVKVITQILKKNGFSKFNKLYLSSDIRKTKSKGALYTYIINDLSCAPSKILHIGDYYDADVINSMKVGIKSYYYKKTSKYALEHKPFNKLRSLYGSQLSIEASIYLAIIINKYYSPRKR